MNRSKCQWALNAALRFTWGRYQCHQKPVRIQQYANTNWSKVCIKKCSYPESLLSFSGGTDKTTSDFLWLFESRRQSVKGKLNQIGITSDHLKKHQANEWLSVTNVTNAYWSRFVGPSGGAWSVLLVNQVFINQFPKVISGNTGFYQWRAWYSGWQRIKMWMFSFLLTTSSCRLESFGRL